MVAATSAFSGPLPDLSAARSGTVPVEAPLPLQYEAERRLLDAPGVEAILKRLCNPQYGPTSCPLLAIEGVSRLQAAFPTAGGSEFTWSSEAALRIRRDSNSQGPMLVIESAHPGSGNFHVDLKGIQVEVWRDEICLKIPGDLAPQFEMSIFFEKAFLHQPKTS